MSVADVAVPEAKKEILAKAEEDVEKVAKQYKRGLITNDERYDSVIKYLGKSYKRRYRSNER